MEKKNSALLIIWVTGLSLFVHEKHESIVEGSEHITDIFVLFFESDGKRFFLKHQIQ